MPWLSLSLQSPLNNFIYILSMSMRWFMDGIDLNRLDLVNKIAFPNVIGPHLIT